MNNQNKETNKQRLEVRARGAAAAMALNSATLEMMVRNIYHSSDFNLIYVKMFLIKLSRYMINSYFISSATHRMVTYPVNISHSSRQLTSNGIQVWIMLMIASELNARANKLWVTGGTQVELRWGKKCLVNSILIYGLEFIIRGQRSLINSRQRKFQSRQWLWVLNNWLTFVDLYDHRVGLILLARSVDLASWLRWSLH